MLKSQLIALLEALPGDPEITLWNGLVRDWQDIDPNFGVTEFVKPSYQLVSSLLTTQAQDQGIEPPTEAEILETMSHHEWDTPNMFVEPQHMDLWYGANRKPMFMIGGLLRNKAVSDRCGTIHY